MRPAAPLLALAALLLLSGCDGPQSVLDAHGPSAVQLRQLIIAIVGVCSLVWALVIVVLIWALFRRRREPGPGHPTSERRMLRVVVASVAATVMIITGFTVASFYATRAATFAGEPDLTIKVRGLQWWWEIEYPDGDAARTFRTANEIRIPVDRTVKLQLDASDVIHSFWVPSLAGKLDLIPGRTNELTIRADRAGVYRGQCAEFCGLQHSHMAVLVIAVPQDAFDQWRDAQRSGAAAPPPGETEAGRDVFMRKQCAACHTIRGTEASGTTGPDLTHVGSRRTIAAGLLDNTRGSLAAWIADPQTLKPGNNMPLVPLSSDELRQVSAYLAGLQ